MIKSSNRDPPQLSAVLKVYNHGFQTIKWAGIQRNTNQPAKPPLYIAKKAFCFHNFSMGKTKSMTIKPWTLPHMLLWTNTAFKHPFICLYALQENVVFLTQKTTAPNTCEVSFVVSSSVQYAVFIVTLNILKPQFDIKLLHMSNSNFYVTYATINTKYSTL